MRMTEQKHRLTEAKGKVKSACTSKESWAKYICSRQVGRVMEGAWKVKSQREEWNGKAQTQKEWKHQENKIRQRSGKDVWVRGMEGGGWGGGDLYGAESAVTEEKIYTLQGEKTWDRSQGVMRIIKFKYRHTEKAHWEGKNGQEKMK